MKKIFFLAFIFIFQVLAAYTNLIGLDGCRANSEIYFEKNDPENDKKKDVSEDNCCADIVIASFYNILKVQSTLSGPYLGQRLPGFSPKLFAKGIISTKYVENNIFFANNGREIYVERIVNGSSVIYLYRNDESGWTDSIRVELKDGGIFSKPTFNCRLDLLITGEYAKSENQSGLAEVFMRKREGETWGHPIQIGPGLQGSISNNGNVYVVIPDISKRSFGRIARYKRQDDKFVGPEILPEIINDPRYSNYNAMISPDESFLVFTSKQSNDEYRQLYISFNENGNWSKPKSLSAALNTNKNGHELFATLSSDGKYLFYNCGGDIYWVDAKIIDLIKKERIK